MMTNLHSLNYIEKWAARDEAGPYRDFILIGDNEPNFLMGQWNWNGSKQIWSVFPNETDVSLSPGQKMKIKLCMIPFDDTDPNLLNNSNHFTNMTKEKSNWS